MEVPRAEFKLDIGHPSVDVVQRLFNFSFLFNHLFGSVLDCYFLFDIQYVAEVWNGT